MLLGGCRLVIVRKMNVLESLGKGVFDPLASRGGFGGIPPPILGCIGPLGARRCHYRDKIGRPLSQEGVLGGFLPHSRDKISPLALTGGLVRGLAGLACPGLL